MSDVFFDNSFYRERIADDEELGLRRSARPSPGKVTRTSRLEPEMAVQLYRLRRAERGDGGAESPRARTTQSSGARAANPAQSSSRLATDSGEREAGIWRSSALACGFSMGQIEAEASAGAPAVQRRRRGRERDDHRAAEAGAQGSGSSLPFLDTIQKAFGEHDLGDVRAYTGAQAHEAASAIGAAAYTRGNDVVFGDAPSLYVAAHEAAHVVQQRQGVSLAGGFGAEGDHYERHADQVANAVVRGQSAEGLLGNVGNVGGGGGASAVQRHPGDNDDGNGDDNGGGDGPDSEERQRLIDSYPPADDFDDSTIVYRFARSPDGAIDAGGRTWWQTQPNVSHGGPLGNEHLLQTTLGELRAQAQVRRDPPEPNQGGDLGTSLVVFHDPDVTSVPGEEVDSGIIGWNQRGQPVYRPGHPQHIRPEGRWVDNDGEAHYGDEEPDGPPFEPWRGGANPTAALDAHDPAPVTGDRDLEAEDPEFHRRINERDYAGAVRHVAESEDEDGDPGEGGEGARNDASSGESEGEGDSDATTRTARPARTGDGEGATESDSAAPDPSPARTGRGNAGDGDASDRDTGTRDMAHRLRQRLREQSRSDDADQARRARQALQQLGDNPDRDQVHAASRAAGIDPATLADPDIPDQAPRRRTSLTGGLDGSLGVNQEADDGSSRGASAQLDQHGVDLEASRSNRDGDESRVGVRYREQRNADGEVIGRDVGVSGGRGPISGRLEGGYTYDLSEPRERDDGSFVVQWTVGARGRSEGSVSAGSVGGGRGTAAHATRTGTQVFEGGTREENLRRAEEWRQGFEGIGMQLYRAASLDLHDIEFWRSAPVGTARQVEIGGELSRSASGSILRFLSLSGNVQVSAAATGGVSKSDESHVEVTQSWTVGGGVGGGGGNLVNVEMGANASHRVSETFSVDLEAGADALSRFLSHRGFIEEGQGGVTLRRRVEEDTTGTTSGASVAVLGGVRGGSSTSEEVETIYDENGRQTGTRTVHHGRREMTGNTVLGDYTRRRFRVDAPESGRPYVIYEDLQSSDDGESAQMLGNATGTGRAGSRARVSGNWVVAEQLSQEDAHNFHLGLLRRFPADGEGPGAGNPMRGVWEELRRDPEAANGGLRARVLADFLSENGRRGVQMIRGVAGTGPGRQYLRHYQNGDETRVDVEGQDQRAAVFLGESRSREIEQWLTRQEAREEIDASAISEARARQARMEARIAQIENVDNFTDMPPALRQSIAGRYRGYRDRLAAIAQRGSDDAMGSMSQDAQDHGDEVRRAREQAERLRQQAATYRHRVLRARRRYGQESSESRPVGHLPPGIASRTEGMWSSAEGAFQSGEDALRDGRNRRSNDAESDAGELETRAGLRSASWSFEQAQSAFEQARREMRELDRVYGRIEAYRRGELQDRDGDGDSRGQGDDEGGSRSAPSRQPEPDSQPDSAEPQREPEPQPSGDGQHPGVPSDALRFRVPAQRLGQKITDYNGAIVVDGSPIRLSNGLSVRALGGLGQFVLVTRAEDNGGIERWAMRMEVVDRAHGARQLVTTCTVRGQVRTFVIDNEPGEQFAAMAERVAPIV